MKPAARRVLVLALTLALLLGSCVPAAPAEAPEVHACGDFRYALLADGTAEIRGYTGAAGEVTVPETLDGRAVTRIGEEAFFYARVTGVTLPAGVTDIGYRAFMDCTELARVGLPAGLVRIGDEAFAGCCRLTAMDLPEGLTFIGNGAFIECSILSTLNLPESLVFLGDEALAGTDVAAVTLPDSLRITDGNPFYRSVVSDVRVSPNHPTLAVADGMLFSKPERRLIFRLWNAPGDVCTVPEGTRIIGNGAFAFSAPWRASSSRTPSPKSGPAPSTAAKTWRRSTSRRASPPSGPPRSSGASV